MARLIDISKFDVFGFQLQEDQTLEFAYGAQWMLEQIDKEPIVEAIPRERMDAMVAEIESLFLSDMHSDIDLGMHIALSQVLTIIHKYTKEQNNEDK